MNFQWHMPIKLMFGAGCLDRLPKVIDELGGKRVVLVAGESAMERSGVLDRLQKMLSGINLKVHSGVRANLPIGDCDDIIRSVREHDADLVVGLGGGSVLDGAKTAAWIGPTDGWARDYLSGRQSGPGIPFVAVPTTSGTGSEVTPFSILMDVEEKKKLSMGSSAAMAKVAIVDPKLTLTLPPDQTAATGLDALSHAFESYWSKFASPLSDAMAREAITTALDHLETAYKTPQDLEARTGMSLAAVTAGLALSQTATAALHGITYPLTARHGIPHGMACAFLMREVLAVNFHHLDTKKQQRLLRHMKSKTIGAAVDLLTDLYVALDVPESLEDLKIPETEIDRFVEEASPKNLDRNITPISREKILELWNKKKS